MSIQLSIATWRTRSADWASGAIPRHYVRLLRYLGLVLGPVVAVHALAVVGHPEMPPPLRLAWQLIALGGVLGALGSMLGAAIHVLRQHEEAEDRFWRAVREQPDAAGPAGPAAGAASPPATGVGSAARR